MSPGFSFGRARALALAPVALILVALPAGAKDLIDGIITFGNAGSLNYLCTGPDPGYLSYTHNDLGVAPLAGFSPLFPSHDFQPAPASIANGEIDPLATIAYPDADTCNTCGATRVVQQACFRGAIDPDGADWTAGWTVHGDLIDVKPAGWNTKPLKFLAGAQPTRTFDADTVYVLQGKVNFPAGTTCTIQPGTLILGENVSSPSYLVIERDADIVANGTPANPIVMTSDTLTPTPGSWGGLVIHGKAVANCADCLGGASCISEGGAGSHCGTNDCDNSGSISYVILAYSGFELAPNNELNVLTMNSVGSGTQIHHIQAHEGSDDAFEWFGGHVSCQYLLDTGCQDDGLDWQMGYRGAIQFAIVQVYPTAGDKGIEADNNEFNFNAPCRSNPLLANITLVGSDAVSSTNLNGAHLRRGTDFQIFNSIVCYFKAHAFRIEHDATCNGLNPQTANAPCAPVDAPVVAAVSSIELRAFPNPVVSGTSFEFALPSAGHARLDVYDVSGRRVANVMDRALEAGPHTVAWTPERDLTAGTYFYRLETDGRPAQGRIVLVR